MRVSTQEYESKKQTFLKRHNDWEVITSPMDEYGRYHKSYICSDNAVWTEINEPEYEKVKIDTEVKGVKVTIEQDIKLFRTEGWSTDDPTSIICYEKF